MRATGLATSIWNNAWKSALLIACFPVLVAAIVYAGLLVEAAWQGTGFQEGLLQAFDRLPEILPWAAAATVLWFVVAWFLNVRIVGLMTGAHPVSRIEEPRLWNLLENLCISQGMPMPKLALIESDSLNAYAAGIKRSQYQIAVTRGLVDELGDRELQSVLAHELAHIRHSDVRLMMVSTVFVGIIALVAELVFRNYDVVVRGGTRSSRRSSESKKGGGGIAAFFLLILVAAAILVAARLLSIVCRMALSRRREYMADMASVDMTHDPEAMVSALRRISGRSVMTSVPSDLRQMFFDEPPGFLASVFSTHPSIEQRVRAIRVVTGTSDAPLPVTGSTRNPGVLAA